MSQLIEEIINGVTGGRGYLNGKYKDTKKDLEKKLLQMNNAELVQDFYKTNRETERQSSSMSKLLKHSTPCFVSSYSFDDEKQYN